ncbi:hypothetical protein QX213_21390 [Vibrio vulnificus]|uniref:hypothetical protein n=1 Tax=Vibrio vulnificus TaxID=672 RepID=UPI001A262ECC|nr:hypothetical protein [Vibrio vulnificus]MCU8133458.1 hypothetical protein [Vibrio vulnificus]MDS1846476.1 hypothetical protein [Vibrio vulnificus]HAS8286770.1 hypothetical protein [Vibrio vulnificus]HCE2447317.1 hypothetical protein [Vibrio parahaemolyticus]
MKPDDDYFSFLGSLSNGANRQLAYTNYKTAAVNAGNNYCFSLNGALKGNVPLTPVQETDLKNLISSIRAKNSQTMTLYRMTSDSEFSAPIWGAISNSKFRYLAFLSTTFDVSKLQNFVPNSGTPLVLEIECPEGTIMSLMENGESTSGECERLIPCGAEFEVISYQTLTGTSRMCYLKPHMTHPEVHLLKLRLIDNPKLFLKIPTSEFFIF